MNRGTLYLIDDQRSRRETLSEALAQRGYQIDSYDSAPTFVAAIDYERVPQRACVLTHLDLTPMSGIELLDVFRADRVTMPVVLTGALADLRLAVKAMRYGGTYILWRPFSAAHLDEVITNVLREWNEAAPPGSAETERDALRAIEDRVASLSRRQRQVLRYVFEGTGNREIADHLGISVKTVELHRACMMKKMQVDNVTALIRTMSDYRHALERCQ